MRFKKLTMALLFVLGLALILIALGIILDWTQNDQVISKWVSLYYISLIGFVIFVIFSILLVVTYLFRQHNIFAISFWLAPTIGLVGLIFSYCIWHAWHYQQGQFLQRQLQTEVTQAKQLLQERIESGVTSLKSTARRWQARGAVPYTEWLIEAEALVTNHKAFNAIEWVDKDHKIQWYYPIDSSNYSSNWQGLVTNLDNKDQIALISSDNNLLLYVPVYVKKAFVGFIIGEIDRQQLFSEIFTNQEAHNFGITIRDSQRLLLQTLPMGKLAKHYDEVSTTLSVLGLKWHITLWPTQQYIDDQENYAFYFLLFAAIGFSLLLALMALIAQFAQRKSEQALQIERQLKEEEIAHKRSKQLNVRLGQALQYNQKLKAIGTFAGGVAHDFNNLLYSIMGYAEMCRQDVEKDTELHGNLGKILEATERGKKLVSGILSFSRQQNKDFEPLELTKLIKDAVDLVKPTLPQGIELKVDNNLDHAAILGNYTKLEQVFINLIKNAIDAIQDKGTVQVRLFEKPAHEEPIFNDSKHKDSRWFCIMIKDDGCGMDEQTIERLFEPFFTTKPVGKGTGLGLATAHGTIQDHNGEVLVNSELGKGSTFYVYLPEYNS